MSTRADPNRRRLTVGVDTGRSQQDGRAGASSGGVEDDDQTLAAMLESYGKPAVSIGAKNVPKQEEFKQKGVEVFATEDKKENIRGRETEEEAFYEMVQDSAFINAIAFKCHKGKKPDAPNQDSFSVLVVEGDFALYCIFDGHGPQGHLASDLARVELVAQFFRRHKVQGQDVPTALEGSFLATQQLAVERNKTRAPDLSMSGTTCTVVYHDMVKQKLHIAYVGDSRAVVGFIDDGKVKLEDATIDHKPGDPKEKERIEGCGGRVVWDGFYNHRVFAADGPYPGLNMSRALGDVTGHEKAGLCATPDIKEFDIGECKLKGSANGKLLLLLCTDGVWEFVGNEEALALLVDESVPADSKALGRKLGQLTHFSYDKWMKDSDYEISDDITGIAVIL